MAFHIFCAIQLSYLRQLVSRGESPGTRKLPLRYQWFEKDFGFEISIVDCNVDSLIAPKLYFRLANALQLLGTCGT